MVYLEKYNPTKTYIFNSGKLATPEAVAKDYPACTVTTFVVGTDEYGESFNSFDSLKKLRSHYGIDKSLSEDEAIAAIQEIINTPKEPRVSEEVSAEERQAAALELIAMSTMPDVEE